MSAFFTSTGQYLSATLVAENGGTIPVPDDHKLVTYWQRWDSGEMPNALNFAYNLHGASGDGFIQSGMDSTHDPAGEARGDGSSSTGQPGISGSYAADTWYLIYMWCNADDGVAGNVTIFEDSFGTNSSAARTWADDTTNDWSDWEIGRSVTAASSEDWKGWVADIAIWTPADTTARNAIINGIYNSGNYLEADGISGIASPDWYDKLTDGIKNNVGTILTNNGTVTFDSAIHPFAAAATGDASSVLFLGI